MKPTKNSLILLFTTIFFLFLMTSAHAQTQVGEKAPGFITSTTDGKRITLKEYWEKQGKRRIECGRQPCSIGQFFVRHGLVPDWNTTLWNNKDSQVG